MHLTSLQEICAKTPVSLCFLIKSNRNLSLHNQTKAPTIADLATPTIGNTIGDLFPYVGILCECYSRSVQIANTLIFEVASSFVHLLTLMMLLIIILGINKKYTAVGRSEYFFFYELLILFITSSLIIDCGVVPKNSTFYVYAVSWQIGLIGSICFTIAMNGLLAFKFWEDGTKKSKIIIRVSSLIGFALNFVVTFGTFNDWFSIRNLDTDKVDSSFSKETDVIWLLAIVYGLNAFCILSYVLSQCMVSLFIVRNYWILGTVMLGAAVFISGQILTYFFSLSVCQESNHYIDGLFCGNLCNLFAFMMIYKSWDIATSDDLEFGVDLNKNYNNNLLI